MNSDTPRTDNAFEINAFNDGHGGVCGMDFVYFTRDLERELAAAKKQLADQANATEWERRYDEEVLKNVQLQAQVAALRRALEEASVALDGALRQAPAYGPLWHGSEEMKASLNAWKNASVALSSPPPKVVPMEDHSFTQSLMGTLKRNPNGCGCRVCNPNASWFVVCDVCGNKRCPHATSHDHACTNSNESGQKGSVFQ